ncbi:hypothetical protein [Nannocystis bainbridge]|uniref:Uncharacterized protein n=1 Tax=Nannocystis bainbridge TaxID=2995303 RepID=A0ABT5E3R0_9BACT|nr:hypothetical protein [Nannocystis bainbridge]MDC0720471.1 hypothetical protein [Nannocystis bainbridge]
MHCLGLNYRRFTLLACALALACVPKGPGGDDTTAATSETSETSETSSATTTLTTTTITTTAPTTTDATTETTGGPEAMCEVDGSENYPDEGMFAVFPEGDVDEPCTLASALEVGSALELTLQCPDFAAQFGGDFVVRIEHGPRPQPSPPAGSILDVFATGFDPGYPFTSHAWLSLRHDGALLYAVTQGEALLSEVGDPAAYEPFTFTRLDDCPFVDGVDTGVVDATLLCQTIARAHLQVLVGGDEALVMSEGETTTVLADAVPYAIDLVALRRLKDCYIEPPADDFPRYDFAIAAQAE